MTLQNTGMAIVYTNQVPFETDVLRTNMYRMADISTLAQTVIGLGVNNATQVSGGNCTPNISPDLSVLIAPITIYQLEEYNSTDYGVIPADSTELYKQGMNLSTTHVTGFSAPGSGTRYYLVQAQLSTNDVNNVNRPYYNSANPSQPIFTSQPDTRVYSVALTIKFSTSSTPAPDAGFVGLWAITVTTGQTTITSGDISQYSGAPFITQSLVNTVTNNSIQQSEMLYAVSIGTANVLVANPQIPFSDIETGSHVFVKANATNTSSATLNISGLGAIAIVKNSDSGLIGLTGGEILLNGIFEFMFDGTSWQLLNPSSSFPVGAMLDFGGGTVPAGFLGCDGSAVSRTTYATLFAQIGTNWGVGDGSTTFNIPDFRRRTAVGSGGAGSGVLGNTVGSYGGEESHVQTELELAAHHHPGSSVTILGNTGNTSGTNVELQLLSTTPATGITLNIASDGMSDPMNVMQPSGVVLKIIKT